MTWRAALRTSFRARNNSAVFGRSFSGTSNGGRTQNAEDDEAEQEQRPRKDPAPRNQLQGGRRRAQWRAGSPRNSRTSCQSLRYRSGCARLEFMRTKQA